MNCAMLTTRWRHQKTGQPCREQQALREPHTHYPFSLGWALALKMRGPGDGVWVLCLSLAAQATYC